jgi:peptidoglycan hydrolase-like protein with peptidoglycan-binding domain
MAHFEHNSDKFGYLNLETMDGVQSALKALGFDPGKVDGRDGPNTQNAVRQFQARATIKVDGIVGEQTRSALMNELDKAQRAAGAVAS